MMKWLRRVLVTIAIVTLALVVAVWAIARDEVRTLRAKAAQAKPVAPVMAAAMVAAEGPYFFERPRWTFRALRIFGPRVVSCGPPASVAFALVRMISPQRRPLRAHPEDAITAWVVSNVFTRDELLRIFAAEVYMGRVEGRHVIGVDAASRAYFQKASSALTPSEAETIASLIRSPTARRQALNKIRGVQPTERARSARTF